MTLTAERARELWSYDPDTGIVRWRSKGQGHLAGEQFGFLGEHGYLIDHALGRTISVHRLIFLLVTGEMPPEVDHRNRVRHDNRWLNLRSATRPENSRNKKRNSHSTEEFKGVSQIGNRFQAHICIDYEIIYLGAYATPEEAARAYDIAAIEHHGEFACTNEMLGLLPKLEEAA